MKLFTFIMLGFIILGTLSCACAVQKQATEQERSLKLESTLLNENYKLFAVRGMGMPIAEHSYLLAKDGKTEIKIQTAEEFAQIVKKITSPEDALALVRLITSQEIRPFLSDVYYSEVHKKVETKSEGEQKAQWFAIEPEQYEKWNLHEPVVTEENGLYKIERFVASYPRLKEQELIPAQLLKIWEWVDAEGKYSMEIQEVIAEGDIIQKILLFTK